MLGRWQGTLCAGISPHNIERRVRGGRLCCKCTLFRYFVQSVLSLIVGQPEISANGHNIKRVKTYKSLGIELDELLSWDEHIVMITEKVTKVIGVLRWLIKIISPTVSPRHHL
jgi:hypothetical protein